MNQQKINTEKTFQSTAKLDSKVVAFGIMFNFGPNREKRYDMASLMILKHYSAKWVDEI
jgi:hypothetical protein